MSTFTDKSKKIFWTEWHHFIQIWDDDKTDIRSIQPHLIKINKIIGRFVTSKNDLEFIKKIKDLELLKETQTIMNDNKTYNTFDVFNSHPSRQIVWNEWNHFLEKWNDDDDDSDIKDISQKLIIFNTVINRLIMSQNETDFILKIQNLKLKTKIINSTKTSNLKSTTSNGELTIELIK